MFRIFVSQIELQLEYEGLKYVVYDGCNLIGGKRSLVLGGVTQFHHRYDDELLLCIL